jgi:hypothetical protein
MRRIRSRVLIVVVTAMLMVISAAPASADVGTLCVRAAPAITVSPGDPGDPGP